MRAILRTMFENWRTMKEVGQLTDREVDDLGLTWDQLETLAKAPANLPDRMAAMAKVFGLSEEEIKREHSAYLDMLTTCATCGSTRLCTAALAHADTLQRSSCGFCPNAETYDGMVLAEAH